ncbi:MAG: PEGA domain-containing protein [Chitinispirillaceae bacterium]|nr:PEGA domain-containing protein [Chitinispirillaceae bacterium]
MINSYKTFFHSKNFISLTIIFCILLLWAGASYSEEECKEGKRVLFLLVDNSVTNRCAYDFAGELYAQLKEPLKEVGYCLRHYEVDSCNDTTSDFGELLFIWLKVSYNKKTTSDSFVEEIIIDSIEELSLSLASCQATGEEEIMKSLRPFLLIHFDRTDILAFTSVLARKIIENLRNQYICHLRVHSNPSGAKVRAKDGLEGITPVEWVIPVGKTVLTCELKGYNTLTRKVEITSPGVYTYIFELNKRQFYHSKFFVPAVIFGTSSAICFGLERYFYENYRNLGKEDRENRPYLFERTFSLAKGFEYASTGTLILSGCFIVLSFIF